MLRPLARAMAASKARIEVYLDCNSPYSFFALTFLLRNKDALNAHGVAVDVNPIFLGGINVGSGNKPPWTLPAKAKYGSFDGARAAKWLGLEPFKQPSFFPIMSLLPMRSMLYIKRHYPEQQYLSAFARLWQSLWREHKDISKPDVFAATLRQDFAEERDVQAIIAAAQSPEWKQLLNDETARVVAGGAFGAPWFFVTDRQGKTEPFFGSDRFHYILQYLDVPFTDIQILPPAKAKI